MPDGSLTMPTLSALSSLPRWVAWQTEDRGGKLTKVPYSPQGQRAKADDPDTWGTRTQAEARAARLPCPFGGGGVGIELGDHLGLALGGIDLDTCRDTASGRLDAWAAEVVARFGSYTEVSPSGTGVKVFFAFDGAMLVALRQAMGTDHGRQFKRHGGGDHPPAIELYVGSRYFAVTDQRLEGTPAELQRVSIDTLLWLIQEAGPAFSGAEWKPKAGTKWASGDGSRSAQAFKIACDVKRGGGDLNAFVAALKADPRAAEWLVEKGQASGGRELRRTWNRAGADDDADDIELTEDGVALAFADRHRDYLRYCHDTGGWHTWTGTHWKLNRDGIAFTWARELVRSMNRKTELKIRAITGKAAFAGAVERFAQRDRAFAVTAETWDRDPFLLGTPGGTVDLKTGELQPSRREHHVTKVTAVAPAPSGTTCDTWLAFLDQATGKDDELIRFLQQWAGYCLTGSTREHALLFIYGPGGNGKSVFLNTVAGIIGDYCRTAPMDTFTSSPGDKHPTDLAMLRGARLVTATETEEGRAWAEARIKQMTGGDLVTARFMRQDFFTYLPQFKLTIAGNHKPALRNVDEAARRRFNIVPFLYKPERPDHRLEEKLKAEWPAILLWMIEGCVDWQRHGLVRPSIVAETTSEYFEAQDTIGRWLAERCTLDAHMTSKPGALMADCRAWAAGNGEAVPSPTQFRGAMEKVRGVKYTKYAGTPIVRGVGLRPPVGDVGEGWGR